MARALRFLGLYALWALVLVLPVEAYFRLTGLGASPRLRVHTSGVLTEPQPETRVVYRREGFAAFEYNADALRGPRLPPLPVDGERRFAFLGDSYTEALQVPTEAMFTERFAALAARPGLTTLNFGMSGENLVSELLRYRFVVRPRRPHVVVLVSTDGDLADVMKYTAHPTARWDGQDVVVDLAAFEWSAPATARLFSVRQTLRDHLEAYVVLQRFQQLAESARALWRGVVGGAERAGPVDAELREGLTVPPENIARYAELLRRLRADVEADGAHLVGVHLPKGYTLRDDDRTFARAYAEAYASAGVPFVSAFDALRASFVARRFTHYGQPARGGGHLTPVGHEAVAAVLVEALDRGPWRAAR